jgi:WD40 repeat protein
MTDVFISYSRKDKEFVTTLYAAFERSKKNIWVDWNDIPLTSDWWLEIEKGIEAADTFLFVISPDSVASNVCAREIHHAVKNNKRLFPIVRRDVTQFEEGNVAHATLQRHNWLLFREEDAFNDAFERLTKAISQDLDYIRKHKQLLVKAIEWNESLRTDSLLLREDALYDAEIWLLESKTKEPKPTELQEEFIIRSRHIEEEENREKIVFLENALAMGNMRAKIGSAVFVVTILLAVGAWIWTYKSLNGASIASNVRLNALDAKTDFNNRGTKLDALLKAVKAGQELKKLLDRSDREIEDTKAILTSNLSQFVYGVNEKNRFVHSSNVTSVAFSPDGKTIVSGTKEGILKLWNLAGKEIKSFNHSAKVTSVTFIPDGTTVASGGEDNTVKLWHLNGKELLQTCKGHTDYVTSLAVSPDGKTIASGSRDKTVRLWSWDGKECRQKMKILAHDNGVTSIAFSPNGKIIASGSSDNNVKLWRSEDGKIQITFKETGKTTSHDSSVKSIAFSPDGRTIASSSRDKSIKLWSINGKLIGFRSPIYRLNIANSLAFSRKGNYLFAGTDDRSIVLFNIDRNDSINFLKYKTVFKGHDSPISSVVFSFDNKTIATASLDNTVRLWSFAPEPRKILKSHNSYVSSVAFSSDGKYIATGSWDNTVKLWNKDGQHLKTFKEHTYNVMSVAFSPDSKSIASASQDFTVKLWNLEEVQAKTLSRDGSAFPAVAFSPDGKTIATGGWDNTVKLRGLDGKMIQKTFLGNDLLYINSLAFSSDGKTIASASQDRTIRLWSLDGSEPKKLTGDGTSINSVAFSPDGKYVAAGTDGGVVKLWNIHGAELNTFNGHSSIVSSVAFSHDSRTIASGSFDNTVKLWNLEGKELQTFKGHTSQVYSVAFSPDGKTLASGSADQTVILWNLDFDDLMAKGCAWLQDYLVHNPNATDEERQMCGIEPRQK